MSHLVGSTRTIDRVSMARLVGKALKRPSVFFEIGTFRRGKKRHDGGV